MKNSMMLAAAIAAVLSQKFSDESAQIVQRDPESYPAPVESKEHSYSARSTPQFDSLDRKTQHNRKRKKIANASRKRNRK